MCDAHFKTKKTARCCFKKIGVERQETTLPKAGVGPTFHLILNTNIPRVETDGVYVHLNLHFLNGDHRIPSSKRLKKDYFQYYFKFKIKC